MFLERKKVNTQFRDILFSLLVLFSRFQFTGDLHDAANQENNKSFAFIRHGEI